MIGTLSGCLNAHDSCDMRSYASLFRVEGVVETPASNDVETEDTIFKEIKQLEKEMKEQDESVLERFQENQEKNKMQEKLIPVMPVKEGISPDELLQQQREAEMKLDLIDVSSSVIIHNSIMFDPELLQELTDTILNYRRQSIQDPEEAITEETKELIEEVIEDEKIFVSFYLGSIMYFSDQNWSIWLNGDRISPLAEVEGVLPVEVDTISDHYVRFVWNDIDIASLAPSWREVL
ncbi:MAG: hypothetical protein MK137_02195, partial [Rickettsiales bacterium]|nr:hypothetical protein [Rickettsiales bacterium]